MNTFLVCWHFCWGQLVQFLKIRVFQGWILVILWPKVMKNYGVPKICAFLGRIFGISLAQGDE